MSDPADERIRWAEQRAGVYDDPDPDIDEPDRLDWYDR